MQALRFFALVVLLLAWCRPYEEYVPVTSATFPPARTPSVVLVDRDASGELPSTAEHETTAPPGVVLPFFPFFPFPQIDLGLGRGLDPTSPPARSPAYGPGYSNAH